MAAKDAQALLSQSEVSGSTTEDVIKELVRCVVEEREGDLDVESVLRLISIVLKHIPTPKKAMETTESRQFFSDCMTTVQKLALKKGEFLLAEVNSVPLYQSIIDSLSPYQAIYKAEDTNDYVANTAVETISILLSSTPLIMNKRTALGVFKYVHSQISRLIDSTLSGMVAESCLDNVMIALSLTVACYRAVRNSEVAAQHFSLSKDYEMVTLIDKLIGALELETQWSKSLRVRALFVELYTSAFAGNYAVTPSACARWIHSSSMYLMASKEPWKFQPDLLVKLLRAMAESIYFHRLSLPTSNYLILRFLTNLNLKAYPPSIDEARAHLQWILEYPTALDASEGRRHWRENGHYQQLEPSSEDQTHQTQKFNIAYGGLQLDTPLSGIDDVLDFVTRKFPSLAGYEKIKFVHATGRLACYLSGDIMKGTNLCRSCDRPTTKFESSKAQLYGFHEVFIAIVESPNFSSTVELRIATATALRRMLSSFTPGFPFDETTSLGLWLMESLKSTSRDLRVAVGRLLPYFLCCADYGEQNAENVFRLLSDVNFANEPSLLETTIMAWYQVARVCEGEKLNLILIKLIRILASKNTLHCSMAFRELQNIASSKGLTPWQLCTPFWSTISIEVVKHMTSQRSLLKTFSELLGISPSEFLIRTMRFTVPYLVLSKQFSTINEIATKCEMTLQQIFIEQQPVVLASLLVKSQELTNDSLTTSEIASFAYQRLVESGVIQKANFTTVAAANIVRTTFEVLRLFKNSGKSHEEHIIKALSCLASTKYTATKSHTELDQLLSENNVLQIVTFCSDTVRNVMGRMSYTAKLQCINAILMLIKCAPTNFRSAIPQICAFLQSALETDLLQRASLDTWAVMLENLLPADLDDNLELAFAVIAQKWDTFTVQAKQSAYEMIEALVKNNGDILKRIYYKKGLPSLSGIEFLKPLNDQLAQLDAARHKPRKLVHLIKRCGNENVNVVRQTLEELRSFVADEQDLILADWNDDKAVFQIRELMTSLLKVLSRFQNSGSDIPVIAAECIGMVGALDHHKIDLVTDAQKGLVITYNFEQAQESISFVSLLLEDYLVKAFRASTDLNSQMFLAFGIQECLRFCNFKAQIEHGDTRAWHKFSPSTRATLHPLLYSRYTANPSQITNCTYPIFSDNISYTTWLHKFCLDTLSRVQGSNAEKIFGVCLTALRSQGQYQGIFNFLLPYAALNVVIGDSTKNREDIFQEIWAILNQPADESTDISFHQTIFHLIDYCAKWTRERKRSNALYRAQKNRGANSTSLVPSQLSSDGPVQVVEDFLARISPETMAKRSFECKSYPRALLYWEEYLHRNSSSLSASDLNSIYSNFQQIYASIDEPDAIDGISTKFSEFDIGQQILRYESTGRWDYALECYEGLQKWDINTETKMLFCLKESGRYEELLARLSEKKTREQETLRDDWVGMGIEVSWLAGQWDALRSWLSLSNGASYEVSLGNALLALNSRDGSLLKNYLTKARHSVIHGLTVSSHSSLAQYRDSLVKLHALADLESIGHLTISGHTVSSTFSSRLNNRLSLVGPDYGARRYLLALRRAALSIAWDREGRKQQIGEAWVLSAQDSRKQGQMGLALHAALQAHHLGLAEGRIENAKLLWDQGEQRKASALLEEVMGPQLVSYMASVSNSEGKIQSLTKKEAEMILLHTEWLDFSGEEGSESVLIRYRALANLYSRWEMVHYRVAKYYQKLYETEMQLPESMRSTNCLTGEYVRKMVSGFLRSLQFGVEFTYESLPRLVTIWLDFAENINTLNGLSAKHQAKIINARKSKLNEINTFMNRYSGWVPSYIFYLALPQLLSRVCLTHREVYGVLHELIVRIAKDYPSRALWSILGVANSKQQTRSERGWKIIHALTKSTSTKTRDYQTVVSSATKMVTALSALASHPVREKYGVVSLRSLNFDRSCLPCGLVVPVQSLMTSSLPNHPDAIKNHRAFPTEVTIHNIDESVTIQSSLQKPKRITIWGADGKEYKILCKPHDDVRKDARLMDFTSTVDKLLSRDEAAARRHLKIATYHVTPLREDFGLIEWVDGAMPLRAITSKYHSARGVTLDWRYIKSALAVSDEDQKVSNFEELLRRYPAVLHEWFIEYFAEPSAWLEARGRFVRTCAVMSIVGYILGLGDRHNENLLVLEKTGELMHVDFDCLFDKGLDLETPERVPFRLTANLVDAMGVSGYEGVFRRSCEVTLRVMRSNQSMLLIILETFVHDPFVEWTMKRRTSTRKVINGLTAARSPEEALANITNKIKGLKGQDSIPLSVSGQVEYVIKLATSSSNLSKMYPGWMPFI